MVSMIGQSFEMMSGQKLWEELVLGYKCAISGGAPIRSVFVSLIVGSCITLVNSGNEMFAGCPPVWWEVVLNFFVPFTISIISSSITKVQALKALPVEYNKLPHRIISEDMPLALAISETLSQELFYDCLV
eukprot:TRINITY_DN5275_c0_g4_i1.p3 TRINITY_DN5275_c0_g4~~TRINITY_DN5275_c0_g4_i1.p3  ORF type:complete len:131 (-),score=16.86 TRINITY_DN5275_c0_g4_i1:171-563(-)